MPEPGEEAMALGIWLSSREESPMKQRPMKQRVVILMAATLAVAFSLTAIAPHADAVGWCDKRHLCLWKNATRSGPAYQISSPRLGCFPIPTGYRNQIKSVYNYSGYDYIVYATADCNSRNSNSPVSIFYPWTMGKMNAYWSTHVASIRGLSYYHIP